MRCTYSEIQIVGVDTKYTCSEMYKEDVNTTHTCLEMWAEGIDTKYNEQLHHINTLL
jgi:hypothetical protein